MSAAENAARKDATDAPPDQRRVRGWYLSLYTLVVISLVLVNSLVVFDAGTQDHQALLAEKRTLSAILSTRRTALASEAGDNAVWTEAYQHLVVHFDRTWMEANYNDSFYKSFGTDRLLLVGSDGVALHYLYRGTPASKAAAAALLADPALRALIASAQQAPPDPAAAVSRAVMIDGQLNLVAACRIARNQPGAAHDPGPGIVFVLTTIVNDAFLASIPADYGLRDLRLVAASGTPATTLSGSVSGALRDGVAGFWEPSLLSLGAAASGGTGMAIAWEAPRPGDMFMRVVLPPALILSLVIAIFGAVAIRHLERNTHRLAQAYVAATAGSDAKSRFLAMMSHELRTPLNSIIGFSEIMCNELFGALGHDKYREYVAHIRGSGRHLLAVINDVLDLSALAGKELVLHERVFDLDLAAAGVLRHLGPAADRARVTLEQRRSGEPLPFFGDEQRISQILVNLLSNAIKFTPEGGRVEVVSWVDEEDRIFLAVRDTGIGISSADIPRALELFGQIDDDLTRRYEGTGLGLPLANLLVARHGGSLEIVGTPGVGTIVTLVFPAGRLARAAVEPLASAF